MVMFLEGGGLSLALVSFFFFFFFFLSFFFFGVFVDLAFTRR